jgi:hypothetical protein
MTETKGRFTKQSPRYLETRPLRPNIVHALVYDRELRMWSPACQDFIGSFPKGTWLATSGVEVTCKGCIKA